MSNRSKEEVIWEGVRTIRRSQLVQDLFDEAAAERLGVNRTDLRAMDLLDQEGPITAGRLAELMRLSPPATTTVVDRLEKIGYARRVRDSDDRRRVMIEVTPLANRRSMEIYGVFKEITWKEFSRYTVAELEVVNRFLADSLRISEEQLDALRAKPTRKLRPSQSGEDRD